SLNPVADLNTAIPGGTGNFTQFSILASLNNGNVVFGGQGSGNQTGVYTTYGGSLSTVISNSTQQLDGKNISNLNVTQQSLSNGNVAFNVVFSDASQASYVAEQSYDYTANVSGSWDTAGNWSYGLKPRAAVYTNIHPDNGVVITGPASATTIR